MANRRKFSGVLADHKINPEDIAVDITPLRKRMVNWFKVPGNVVMALMVIAGACWYYSDFAAWFFLVATGLAFWGKLQKEETPLKMPIQGKTLDSNQPHPATGAPMAGQGIFFVGNDLRNGKEIWLTNDDCRQHFLILGTTGAGKAGDVDSHVHTPMGWRRLGDIAIGDKISNPAGGNSSVVGVYPQGARQMWRLYFADGRTAEVDAEHLWQVHHRSAIHGNTAASGPAQSIVTTTRELKARMDACPSDSWSIPLSCALEKPQGVLDVEPYALGAILAAHADGAGIPQPYQDASLEQRWALLQGLLDARGVCDGHKPSIRYTCHTQSLAQDICQLVWSLGGVARATNRAGSHSHVVDIRHPELHKCFRQARKVGLASRVARRPGTPVLAIARIEPLDRVANAVCIQVDDPRHLYVMDHYVVTHNTETLLGFAANALSWGSGFLFCDGKGDVALFAKVYAMARRFGREDDLLVLNFMTGNKDLGASGGELLSNTLNPFSNGSSDGLTQMVVSLMDDVGGDGAMWKGRATAMLTGVMRALCWLRDKGIIDLNVSEIRDHMSLKKIIELADEAKYPDLPGPIRKSIKSYLTSLPGFQEEKKEKQAQTTLDQHGYLEMQFTKILGSLADVYGHIFATPYGEVDMYDVVLSRRILVIMLPALEKAGDEIANLGKIVVATLKGMMGATLGSKLQGSWDDVVENRATNSPSPFLVILDEVGYYTVEGMALMAAQARSLGFSMCYASQDVNAMKRLNEKEAASIIANTNTKIFMKMEDPNETADLALKRAGKATRVRAGGYDRKVGELAGKYAIEGEGGSLEDADVIHLSDLTGQMSGEMHVISGDKTLRAKGFYAQPEGGVDKNLLKLRANHFIKVPRPSQDSIAISTRGPEILAKLSSPHTPEELLREVAAAQQGIAEGVAAKDEIAIAAQRFEQVLAKGRKPYEASCAALADVMRTLNSHLSAFGDDVRGSYAQSVPGGSNPFDMGEFDDDNFGDPFATAGRRKGNMFEDEDPFGVPGGIPLGADSTPPYPPNRNRVAGAGMGMGMGKKKPQRVDANVRHGATVNQGGMIDMADRISSNDAIMRSLAALEFDGDQVSANQVEARIEQALGNVSPKASVVDAIASKVDSFDRAAGSIVPPRDPVIPKAPTVYKDPFQDALKEPPRGGGDDDEGGEGEYVVDFLEGLLGGGNDDED